MMKKIPITEKFFEKSTAIQRIDIFEADINRIEEFLKKLPEKDKQKILTTADKAISGRITAFSSIELDYSYPINWNYNPITKIEVSNSLKWYQIPDFDPTRGDIKVVWEASRLTHFYFFARAYLLSKDKKYYEAFSVQLESWINNNKYSYGANYKCGQEASLRMLNVLITYSVFKNCGLITNRDKENLFRLVEGSYKKVLSNFFYTYKCIKNNHTLSEITGLIVGAWCSKNNFRLKKAYKLLNKEISKQFLQDGGYIQNSFNYQRLALQLMCFNLKISDVTKMNISCKNQERIKNSALQMYHLQDASGDLPNRGANDGALIFPITSCGYRDFRPIINTISCLTNNERLYEYGLYDEELLWFGNRSIDNYPIKIIQRKSKAFEESGLYCLRDNDNSFIMAILKNNKTRPSHMDQLHIDLWHKGINIFCDNGSYSYADPIGKNMALTSAHNTVKIDNIEQMNKKGAFLVTDWSKRKSLKFSNKSFVGTLLSKNGYRHTRKITRNENVFSISDEISGKGRTCEFLFHTPCEVKKTINGFELHHNDELVCKVKNVGSIEVSKTFNSLYYMKKTEINCVTVYQKMLNNSCSISFELTLY